MLLIRELGRLLGQAVAFSVATRRIVLLVVIVLTVSVALVSSLIVKVGPVAVYPFL